MLLVIFSLVANSIDDWTLRLVGQETGRPRLCLTCVEWIVSELFDYIIVSLAFGASIQVARRCFWTF